MIYARGAGRARLRIPVERAGLGAVAHHLARPAQAAPEHQAQERHSLAALPGDRPADLAVGEHPIFMLERDIPEKLLVSHRLEAEQAGELGDLAAVGRAVGARRGEVGPGRDDRP